MPKEKTVMEETNAIYAIRHKISGKFCKFGPKVGWNNQSGCVRAFQMHNGVKFKDVKDDFEVVCLTDVYAQFQEMKKELAELRYQTSWTTGSNGR